MAETVKVKDFIEIDYDGMLKEGNLLFDTTRESVAKENSVYSAKMKYKPAIVCVGENFLVKGLDADVIGKEIGKPYKIELNAENAFGKKNAKLIQLVPTSKFRKQNINPMPGMQIDIDGTIGIVKTANGGRVMVDFNHPLAGKDIIYNYTVNKIITDDAEKIKGYFDIALNVTAEVVNKGGVYEIKTKYPMPDILAAEIEKKLKSLISEDLKVSFPKEDKPKKENKAKPEEKIE